MKQSATTTRLLSMQGKRVNAVPVSRWTASRRGKSPTRLKVSLSPPTAALQPRLTGMELAGRAQPPGTHAPFDKGLCAM